MLAPKNSLKLKLLSKQDIDNYESIHQSLTTQDSNVLVHSNSQKLLNYIYNCLFDELIKESNKNLLIYQYEKLDSFIADLLLGPFELAFSKLTDNQQNKKKPVCRVLLIKDLSILDEREIDLIANLNKYNQERKGTIAIFTSNKAKIASEQSKLKNFYRNSIQWEPNDFVVNEQKKIHPDMLINDRIEQRAFKKSPNRKKPSRLPIYILALLILTYIPLFFSIDSLERAKETINQYIDLKDLSLKISFVQLNKTPIYYSYDDEQKLTYPKQIISKDLETPSFHNIDDFVIQYYAHEKKIKVINWVEDKKIKDTEIIKLKKIDNTNFFAAISVPFESYQEAKNYISKKKISGKHLIRPLKSLKKTEEINNITRSNF
ncbi:MAG: hypothetical protein CMP38_05675 [Rickettsiales bacterium]|nr:hypothetical protein [Rickettsiales bacterium]OUW00673.1 MAG: hypothetical protein CBD16_06275 [Betaproteobacteria bacterium TMED156]